MTKEEFYKNFISLHKKCGQGMSGIVKIASMEYARYLDELIEEGLVKACDTGGSLGHPETNIFYMPTKGYNVFEDDGVDGVYVRHKGRYLDFVRFYLGALEGDPNKSLSKDDENLRKSINPTMLDVARNVDFMKSYTEWLERNEKELEVMLDIDDFYKSPKIEFSEDELEWIKSRDTYKKNKSIKDSIKEYQKRLEDDKLIIEYSKQLLNLHKRSEEIGGASKDSEKEKCLSDINTSEKNILTNKKLQNLLSLEDKSLNLQDVL